MVDDDDLLQTARDRMDAAWNHDRQNREDAFSDLKFLAGDQWPEIARQQREAANRPVLTINRLPQFVNQVANDVRKNPPGIKAVAAGKDATEEIAEVYTGLFRHIQARSHATHVFAHAEYYAVACGIGHFRIVTDYANEDGFEQEIQIKRIPHPLSVLWDPAAIEPSRCDAQYCIITEMIPRAEFKVRFPNASETSFEIPRDGVSENGLFWSTEDHVVIAEYWEKVPKSRTIASLQDGQVIDITDVEKSELAKQPIVQTRVVKSYEVKHSLLSGTEVLEAPKTWIGRDIPIFPVIGAEIALETSIIRHGLIRFARDPQQMYNFMRSAAAETIALAPRAPFLVTPAMIGKYKAQWDTQNTVSRPYLLYEPDSDAPGASPRREPPPAVPQAFIEEAKIASDEMKATTGIYDAALGARSNETSGVAIRARESQGETSTLHFQDNLVATLHHVGKVLVDLVPKIYDSERIVRIVQEDDTEQLVPINTQTIGKDGSPMLLNDLSQGMYDVNVKIGPAYSTRRAEASESMLQFVQSVPQSAEVIGDLVAKAMDWPGAEEIATRLKKMLPPALQEPDNSPEGQQQAAQSQAMQAQQMQQQQEIQALQQAMAAANLQKVQSEAQKIAAEAQKTMAEAHRFSASGMEGSTPVQQQDAGADFTRAHQAAASSDDARLKSATIREREARATKAEVETQLSLQKLRAGEALPHRYDQ